LHIYHTLYHTYSVMLIVNFKNFLLLSVQIHLLLTLWSIWSIRLSVNCCESHWSRHKNVIICITYNRNLTSFYWNSTCCIWCCNASSVYKIIVVLSIMLILILELLLCVFIAIVISDISFIWYSNRSFLIVTV
jgi:hypothetical protein